MTYDDFCQCTFDEFEGICDAWRQMREGESRDSWERARTVAAIIIQPHVRKRITPRQLLPMPWDAKTERPQNQPTLTPEQRQKRFEALTHRVG